MVNLAFFLHLQPGNYGEGTAPLLAALTGQKIPEGKCILRISSTECVYYA